MEDLRTEPRQRRSRESIDAILDAAERLIHRKGQVSFTANELAIAANMSIGRVYYWFPDMPAVVNALADRGAMRMIELFSRILDFERTAPTPVVIGETLDALCDYIDQNPATVALCLTGNDTGEDYGLRLREQMRDVTRRLVEQRVPDVPDDEAYLVASTAVGIMLGMLNGYTRAGDRRPFIKQELVYVLTAWLYCRYPSHDDPVWNDPTRMVQPSRLPRAAPGEPSPIWPAMSPRQPR